MNCFKFILLYVSCCVLLVGCKGTGILMMPSKDNPFNSKFKCSSAFINGYWIGKYEKSKIEIDIKADNNKNNPCSADIWIYDKDKKQPIIPMNVIPFRIKEDKYVLLCPTIDKMVKKGNYSDISLGFLYPVMKIFKVTESGPDKLSYQEVIFTKKEGKDKTVKLDPSMKMWGDNSNTLYGTSTEIIGYLEKGKYQLSEKSELMKSGDSPKKPAEAKKK